MIILRVEDFSSLAGLIVRNAFVMNGTIYCIGAEPNAPWAMYAIDTTTFAVKEIPVDFTSFHPPTWSDITRPIVVHGNEAFAWLPLENKIAVGELVDGCFRWKPVDIAGAPEDEDEWDFRGVEGESRNMFRTSFHERRDYMWVLDLASRAWSQCFEITDPLVLRVLDSPDTIIEAAGKIHILSRLLINDVIRNHVVMDKATMTWAVANDQFTNAYFRSSRLFKLRDQLYEIRQVLGENSITIFMFDTKKGKWNRIWNSDENITMDLKFDYQTDIVVDGSRLIVIDGTGPRGMIRLGKVYIFEMEPTLFDRAFSTVLGDEKLRKLGESVLSRSLGVAFNRVESGDKVVPILPTDRETEDMM